jgi:hypothetical protein
MRTRGQRERMRRTVHRPRAGVDIRATQLGCEQMATAEHVKRQTAVTVVVAVEEPAFLVPVQRIVGRIEIERDLLGSSPVRLEEEIDEQRLALQPPAGGEAKKVSTALAQEQEVGVR